MVSLAIGYSRVSRFGADGAEHRTALLALGVDPDRVYLDEGLTGMSRPRPALREALAATREGDTLVVTALARLARSVPDAHQLLTQLSGAGVAVVIGEDQYSPNQTDTGALVQGLALAADLRAGLGSGRTREGLALARTRGQLQGRPPKLSQPQEHHLVGLYQSDHDTVREIGELFNVSRSTVCRAVDRADRSADSAAHHDG